MFELETLDLSYNEFIGLSEDSANTLCELTNLKTLNFSHNLFNEPAMPTKQDCFNELKTFDLSHNSIQYLTPEFMKEVDDVNELNGKLKNVFLHENPFHCDCGLQGTWQWLKETKAPVNKDQLLCSSSYQSLNNGKRVIDLELGDLVCQKAVVQSNIQSSVQVEIALVLTIMLLVLVVSMIAFAFVHRDKFGLVARRWQNNNPGREVLVPYTILLPSEKGKDITI
ncbi:trophoblast glycoprotein-like [Dreissena polymorpha]|nr:trophoblast glycoprotein-like [Dreissena polymorpha]